jgi:hypothetical protein
MVRALCHSMTTLKSGRRSAIVDYAASRSELSVMNEFRVTGKIRGYAFPL